MGTLVERHMIFPTESDIGKRVRFIHNQKRQGELKGLAKSYVYVCFDGERWNSHCRRMDLEFVEEAAA